MRNKIILFENEELKLKVNIKDETVWLNRQQLSKLFGRDIKTIGKHINNSLKGELDDSVVANFATTAKDGKVYQIDYYNLDMIISIGYRVKSQNGIIFRKWANKILKDYMLKGYAINQKRLEYLEKTIQIIDIANRIDNTYLENKEALDILNVIGKYTKSLEMLDNYDYKKITKPVGTKTLVKIKYNECLELINILKNNQKSNIFALEKNRGLESIINDIYTTYDKKELYLTTEEKAANFLYMIVKNHVFIDGNKRIAATLFIYFLQINNILYKNDNQVIDNNTLTALTLLVAESNPKEKPLIIDLILNFLT